MRYELDDRQHATVLAALRTYQATNGGSDAYLPGDRSVDVENIASNHGSVDPLSIEEIDDLCEAINIDPAATPDEIQRAKNAYECDNVKIDSDALSSPCDDGSVWVEAWVLLDGDEDE